MRREEPCLFRADLERDLKGERMECQFIYLLRHNIPHFSVAHWRNMTACPESTLYYPLPSHYAHKPWSWILRLRRSEALFESVYDMFKIRLRRRRRP